MTDIVASLKQTLDLNIGAERQARLSSAVNAPLLLKTLSMSEGLSQEYNASIVAYSHDDSIDLQALLGKVFTVEFDVSPIKKRYFSGYLTAAQYLGHPAEHAEYQLTLKPFLSLLGRTSDCRIFQNQSIPDIVKAVCSEKNFTNIEARLIGTYKPWDYCVQYRETTQNFIKRLLEQVGIYYFYEHEKDKHTLILADHGGAHKPIAGNASIPYQVPGKAVLQEAQVFDSWHTQEIVQTGAYALQDHNLLTPGEDLAVRTQASATYDYGDYEFYDYPGEYEKKAAGDAYVKQRLEALQVKAVESTGSSNAGYLLPGGLFTLTGHPRKQENKEYCIVSAQHQLSVGGYRVGSSEAFDYSNSITAVPSATPYRPALTTPKPLVEGIQTAVVTGPEGQEIWPDEHGRVIVQFHWDRLGKKNETSTCWVPVSHNWAGKQWGSQFLPRIGDEVIVSFIEGDPDRPVITGRLYNGQNKPIYELPANKTQSGVKTHSSSGGGPDNYNAIRFEDKAGSEEIFVQAEKDQNITVKNNESVSVGNDRTKSIGNNETTSVGNDRAETVGNNETISIGVDRSETVGSNETITIGADRTETVGSNESVTVGTNRTHSIGSNDSLSVGSSKTETVAINSAETIGAAKELTIGGLYQVTVGAAMNETVGGAKAEEVGLVKAVVVGLNMSENVGGNRSVDVSKTSTHKAKKIAITAEDELSITVGKAKLVMKKDGTISLSGKDVKIDGSGAINIKAKKNLVLKGKKILEN